MGHAACASTFVCPCVCACVDWASSGKKWQSCTKHEYDAARPSMSVLQLTLAWLCGAAYSGTSDLVQVQASFNHLLICTTLLLVCRTAKGDHGVNTKTIRQISELGWEASQRTSCIPCVCHCFCSNASPLKSCAPPCTSVLEKCAPLDNTLHHLADVACVA